MKKLIFCTFIPLMFHFPQISSADMIPPSPCDLCRSCIDCDTGTVNSERRSKSCSFCSQCGDLEGLIEDECKKRKCSFYCPELCSDCETNKYKTEPGCEECHTLCSDREEADVSFICRDSNESKICKQCVDKCGDCETNQYRDTPECEECRTSLCRSPNIELLCKLTKCDYLCPDDCFDCNTNKFKNVPECKDCLKSCASIRYKLEPICEGINIDWCAYHCFDCQTNGKTASNLYCTVCNYTIEELKSKCPKADAIHQPDTPPQVNSDQPQANAEQPQKNADQPQVNAEQPQANAEQPQKNADQPQEKIDNSMRKSKVLCSADPFMPSSTSISWLMMFLITLGLLMHLRRVDK